MKLRNAFNRFASRFCFLLSGMTILSNVDLPAQTGETSDTARQRVTVGGEIRHRYELDGRVKGADDEKAFGDYHLLRSRAQITYAPADDIEATVQIQDARHFGQENGGAGRGTLDADAPALDLHQAHVMVRNLFESGIDLQFGRQEMSYGNERLIGAAGWNNTGRSFDAVRLMVEEDWGRVDLFASRLQGTLGLDPSQNFYGLYSRIDFSREHKGDFFALLDNNTAEIAFGPDSGSALLSRYTLGTFLRGGFSSVKYEAEFAWQGGDAGDTNGLRSIGAMLLSGMVAYESDQVRVGALYTYLSGDDDPADDKRETFNTLFATNHKFYGHVDYFPGAYTENGLQDIALLTGLKMSDKTRLDLEGHLLTTAVDVGEENALGKEINAVFKYKHNKAVSFNAGVALFLADDLMKAIIGDDMGWWGYLMTTVTL